jgi:peptide/nickel transport system substrate-binding protein
VNHHERVQSVGRSRRNKVARLSVFTAGVVVIIVAIGLVVYSELSRQTSIAPEPDSAEQPDQQATPRPETVVRLDTYIEADIGFPQTLNPILARSRSERNVSKLLYRGLIAIDGSGMPSADLAISWTMSDDGLTYTLTLDPDARWHDGAPVTASDIIFTVNLVQDPEYPGDRELGRFWRAIRVERVDDATVSFHLLEPFAGFINHLTLPILPRHVLGAVLPSDLHDSGFSWEPVGNGPYALVSADPDSQTIKLSVVEQGVSAGIEMIEFRYFDDIGEMLEAFRDGDVMGVSYVPFEAVQQSGMLPDGARVYAPAMPGYTALYFNLRHPLFRDVAVRKAIEYAIDREWIVQEVLAGQASAGSSPIPGPLWYSDPGNHRAHDPDEARRLLEASGWRPSDIDGVLETEGQRLSFALLVNADDSRRLAVAYAIQEQLANVGIRVDVQPMGTAEVNAALTSRQFTVALYGWHAANGDPDCFQMWHSSQTEHGLNFSGLSDHDVDSLLTEARQTADREERRRLYGEFQEAFADLAPAVVLYYPRYHFAVSAAVHGADPTSLVDPSDRMRQIPGWYVEVVDAEEEAG